MFLTEEKFDFISDHSYQNSSILDLYKVLEESIDDYEYLNQKLIKQNRLYSKNPYNILIKESVVDIGIKVKDLLVRIWEALKRLIFKFINFVRSTVMKIMYNTKITTADIDAIKDKKVYCYANQLAIFDYIHNADFENFFKTSSTELVNGIMSFNSRDERKDFKKEIKENFEEIKENIKLKKLNDLTDTDYQGQEGDEVLLSIDKIKTAQKSLSTAKLKIEQANNLYRKCQEIYKEDKNAETSRNLTLAARVVGWILVLYSKIFKSDVIILKCAKLKHKPTSSYDKEAKKDNEEKPTEQPQPEPGPFYPATVLVNKAKSKFDDLFDDEKRDRKNYNEVIKDYDDLNSLF